MVTMSNEDRITAPRALIVQAADINLPGLGKLKPGDLIDIAAVTGAVVVATHVVLVNGASKLRVVVDVPTLDITATPDP